jgi:hypothetical protein
VICLFFALEGICVTHIESHRTSFFWYLTVLITTFRPRQLNACDPPRVIKETGPFTFTIGDTRGMGAYKSGGRFRQVQSLI